MPLIPERVWALMTPDEQAAHKAMVDGWKYSPSFKCPGCGIETAVTLSIKVDSVRAEGVRDDKPTAPHAPLRTPAEARLLKDARDCGMFDAFTRAVEHEKQGQAPRDVDGFFLLFFKTAQVTRVPNDTLNVYRRVYGAGDIAFFQSNGIAAVVCDRIVREIVPYSLLRTAPQRHGLLPKVVRPNEERLEQWVRGRFGYVPVGSTDFADALKERSIGSFGRLVQ